MSLVAPPPPRSLSYIAGLATILYTVPFSFTGISLSHNTDAANQGRHDKVTLDAGNQHQALPRGNISSIHMLITPTAQQKLTRYPRPVIIGRFNAIFENFQRWETLNFVLSAGFLAFSITVDLQHNGARIRLELV